MPFPGGSYYAEFTTANPLTGAAQNGDSLPTATASKNGVDDVLFVLTVTNLDTGRYKVTGTVPFTYADGDSVQVSAAATVASVAGKGVIDQFTVDPAPNQAIPNYAFIMTLSSDHFSPALGKSVAATRSIDGGLFLPCDNTPTETGGGWYKTDITSTDLTCVSSVAIQFTAPGCDITGFTILRN